MISKVKGVFRCNYDAESIALHAVAEAEQAEKIAIAAFVVVSHVMNVIPCKHNSDVPSTNQFSLSSHEGRVYR
jgi:hypothetical protein